MTNIEIPYNWNPRPHQMPAWQKLEAGYKRGVFKWHRRAGKDDVCMHWTATQAIQAPANYWHLLPEYNQARKAIWTAINPHTGKRRIDEVFPLEIRKKTLDQEMIIELVNGSIWQVLGSDRYNSLVGSPPKGVVFSEYALSDPQAWSYIRPMLLENGGWALFNSTVRGRNHFWNLCEMAREEDGWFLSELDANDTGVFTKEQLAGELREYQRERGQEEGEALFNQEYHNDPNASLPGAIYAKQLTRMLKDGAITRVPYDPSVPVITAWDIGFHDATVIWFAQPVGREIRIIDCYYASGSEVPDFVKHLNSLPYVFYAHILPHDGGHGNVRGPSVKMQLASFGLKNVQVLERPNDIQPEISKTKVFLPRCVFDASKCARGLEGLNSYHREWDKDLMKYKDKPKHDWASNFADAFRYLAVGFFAPQTFASGPVRMQGNWNPLNL